MLYETGGKRPRLGEGAFVAPGAVVSGDCSLGRESGVWHGAALRGDLAPIVVGERSNVQDGAVLHVDTGVPCVVGAGCTVGHLAVLHGCDVGDDCLIGMGAVVLTGARIGAGSVVGAGALVTQGKSFPPRSLIVGSPAKAIGTIDDAALEKLRGNAATYVALAREAAEAILLSPEECRG